MLLGNTMRSLFFANFVFPLLLLASADDPCSENLTRLGLRPLGREVLDEHLRALSRFALEEVQKHGQPSSVQAGLREDLQRKLRELAERSALPLEEVQRRLLESKRRELFGGRSSARASKADLLKREIGLIPKRFAEGVFDRSAKGNFSALAFHPDGDRLAVATNRQVTVLDASSSIRLQTLEEFSVFGRSTETVLVVAYSPQGDILASSSNEKAVKIWSTAGEELKTLSSRGRILNLSFSPDGKFLAGCSDGNQLWLWNLDPAQSRGIFGSRDPGQPTLLHRNSARARFSSDGKLVASTSGKLWVWDDVSGGTWMRNRFRSRRPRVISVDGDFGAGQISLSGDGKKAAMAALGKIGVWNLDGHTVPKIWHTDSAESPYERVLVAFSPDGASVASGSKTGVKIWDAETGSLRQHLKRLLDVWSIAFSPDGQTLVAGSADALAYWHKSASVVGLEDLEDGWE